MVEISLYCEGELDCPNRVVLDPVEVEKIRADNKNILCPVCKPKYGHLSQKENMELGWKNLSDDIDKPSNPEEPR